MTNDYLRKIEQRLETATSGEWFEEPLSGDSYRVVDENGTPICLLDCWEEAVFIANAPNDIRKLIKTIRELKVNCTNDERLRIIKILSFRKNNARKNCSSQVASHAEILASDGLADGLEEIIEELCELCQEKHNEKSEDADIEVESIPDF